MITPHIHLSQFSSVVIHERELNQNLPQLGGQDYLNQHCKLHHLIENNGDICPGFILLVHNILILQDLPKNHLGINIILPLQALLNLLVTQLLEALLNLLNNPTQSFTHSTLLCFDLGRCIPVHRAVPMEEGAYRRHHRPND